MKILFTSLYDARFGLGGAERVALDLAYAMRDIYRDEIAFCINPGDAAEELKRNRIPVFEIPFEKFKTLNLVLVLNKVVNEFQPDLIHSHHRYTTFFSDLLFKSKSKVLHTEEVFRRDKKAGFRYGHFSAACHEAVRQNLIDYYHVPPEKTVTILNAVKRPQADASALNALLKKYPKQKDQLTALCIARLEEQKGHTYLIDAVSLLPPEKRRKLRIFLAGDGSLKESLIRQVSDKGVTDQFIFLGYCTQTAEFLNLCDFTLQPSVWEGSPLTLLLSFGAGKPVIGTDIEGIRDVVSHDRNGLLTSPNNPVRLAETIESVLDHPERLQILSAQTETAWQHFSSMERTADAYHRLYQQLTGATK